MCCWISSGFFICHLVCLSIQLMYKHTQFIKIHYPTHVHYPTLLEHINTTHIELFTKTSWNDTFDCVGSLDITCTLCKSLLIVLFTLCKYLLILFTDPVSCHCHHCSLLRRTDQENHIIWRRQKLGMYWRHALYIKDTHCIKLNDEIKYILDYWCVY